jgi:hypothetical protein
MKRYKFTLFLTLFGIFLSSHSFAQDDGKARIEALMRENVTNARGTSQQKEAEAVLNNYNKLPESQQKALIEYGYRESGRQLREELQGR